jgi:serine/threonine protein kinase
MPLASGTQVGPYQITALIGKGGMGEVYRARDTTLKRDVALKVLPASLNADHDRIARFQREAEVLAQLDHPNIAPIFGMIESDGTRALALGLIEGPTLAEHIATGPIPREEALAIAKQIIAALEYAHDRGVVHRDLKPSNIKINRAAHKLLRRAPPPRAFGKITPLAW